MTPTIRSYRLTDHDRMLLVIIAWPDGIEHEFGVLNPEEPGAPFHPDQLEAGKAAAITKAEMWKV